MKNKYFKQVYRNSYSEAKRLNEVVQWEESAEENNLCADFIENMIELGYDGVRLKDDVAKQTIEEFGYHRTAFVLATTVNHNSTDGRFSRENKSWAKGITHIADEPSVEYRVDAHPVIIDGFINQYMREFENLQLFDLSKIDTEQNDYTDKVIAIKQSALAEKYLMQQDQIYLATGGFGCEPNKSGRAVFTTCLSDGEKVRWDRSQVLGVIKDEFIPDYAKAILKDIRGFSKEELEKELLDTLLKDFNEIENHCYTVLEKERSLGMKDNINIAIAIKSGEYEIDEYYYSSEDLAKKYVEQNFPALDELIYENIYWEWLANDLISNEPEFMEKTYGINSEDDPTEVYTGENAKELIEEFNEQEKSMKME